MAERNALEASKTVAGYRIIEESGRDAYGIFYRVAAADDDTDAGKVYMLRECYPAGLATRMVGGKHISPIGDFEAPRLRNLISLTERSVSRYVSLRTWGFVPEREYILENNTIYQVWDEPTGPSLAEQRQGGERFTQADLKDMLNACLTSLNRLHGWSFIHAALTPENIFRNAEGEIEMSFPELGLAERARKASGGEPSEFSAYAAPEQVRPTGADIDFKADLYSIAASFYYLITGDAPASAEDRLAAQDNNGKDPLDVARLKSNLADKSFVEVLVSALSLDPARRPFSATVFSTLLMGGAGGRPIALGSTIRESKSSPLPKLLAGVAALAVIGVAGWFGYSYLTSRSGDEVVTAKSEVQGFTRPVVAQKENAAADEASPVSSDVDDAPDAENATTQTPSPSPVPSPVTSPVQSPAASPTRTTPSPVTLSANPTTEEAAWAKASSEDTWWSYRVYLQSFGPNSARPGVHAEEARRLYEERGDQRVANVRAARQLLAQLGYDTPSGTSMDAELSRQIAEFQRQQGIVVNGDATSDLVAALRAAAAAQ